MAAAPKTPTLQRAIVDGAYLMEIDDAVALLALISKADKVERNWTANAFLFKLVDRDREGVRFKVLTPADEARMAMDSQGEDK